MQSFGQGVVDLGSFSFTQDPVCDYTDTITTPGKPDFVIVDPTAKTIQIAEVTDADSIGEHTFQIVSQIEYTIDSQGNTATFTSSIDVTVTVDTCIKTDLTLESIAEMTYRIGDIGSIERDYTVS